MSEIQRFKFGYTNRETREFVTEEPRLLISVDGTEKSLVVGERLALATVPRNVDDAVLWDKARVRVEEMGRQWRARNPAAAAAAAAAAQ